LVYGSISSPFFSIFCPVPWREVSLLFFSLSFCSRVGEVLSCGRKIVKVVGLGVLDPENMADKVVSSSFYFLS
jgi:hypothetical protein